MIEIKKFSKYYDNQLILNKISLLAPKGKTLVVIGKSGCGKSTLLRHIAGLENSETGKLEGSITISDDIVITTMKEKDIVKKNIRGCMIGMLFQHSALFDFLNVENNLRWAMEENLHLSEDEMMETILESLEMVDIDSSFLKRDVNNLSGGERKRIALARALVLKPEIILYDEPTTGLDPPTAWEINKLINRLREKKNITSIVTTHDMWSAKQIADQIAMISHKKLIFTGTYEEASQNTQVKNFIEGLEG